MNSAVLIVDGGPDWSVKSTTTLMALGRLWRDNQLDHLVAVSYAPYQSRINPIEHAWSPRSNDLTGLRLSAILDGETVPPSMQSALSEDDALRKEAVVHDLAITTVASHWAGKKYDGHDVSPVMLECLSPSRHVECDRHEELCKFTSAAVQALSTDSRLKEMKAEYKFFSRHVDRRNHFLAFMKCDDPKCHHCSKNAIQSKKSMAVLHKCGGFFTPTSGSNNPGHFMSYQDMSLHLLGLDEKPAAPDQFIAQDGKAPDSCIKFHYIYTSAADNGRHQRLAHGGAASKAPAEHACSYSSEDGVCGLQFHSYYALMKHKTTVSHKCSRGRPKKN